MLSKAIFVFRSLFVCFEAQMTLTYIFQPTHSICGCSGKEVIMDWLDLISVPEDNLIDIPTRYSIHIDAKSKIINKMAFGGSYLVCKEILQVLITSTLFIGTYHIPCCRVVCRMLLYAIFFIIVAFRKAMPWGHLRSISIWLIVALSFV